MPKRYKFTENNPTRFLSFDLTTYSSRAFSSSEFETQNVFF